MIKPCSLSVVPSSYFLLLVTLLVDQKNLLLLHHHPNPFWVIELKNYLHGQYDDMLRVKLQFIFGDRPNFPQGSVLSVMKPDMKT